LEDIRRIAFETVLRACAFGSLAIFCIMVGLSFNALVAFQSGGFLTMLMAAILILKAYEARTKHYRRTEMWLYLPKEARPPAAAAQQITATVMRETYLTFALWTSVISIVMWGIALLFSLAGT
jgi:amino acid transporter